MTVRETTTPEHTTLGQRQFAVQLHEFHAVVIEIGVTHLRDKGIYDEPVKLHPAAEIITNADLTTALIQIAARSLNTPGSTLP